MLILKPEDVRMNATVKDKSEALALIAQVLCDDGLADGEYLQGLVTREGQSNTYLGQGIAIPHGTPESRKYIKQTGVRLVHFADGVAWNDDGDVVHLAVAISAKSDEHLGILKSLTQVLSVDVADNIKNATTAEQIVALLTDQSVSLQLHENLIKTQVNADSIDALYAQALQLFKSQGVIDSTMVSTDITPLAKGILCASIDGVAVQKPALAMLVAKSALKHQNDLVHALVVVANHKNLDIGKLSTVYDVLLNEGFGEAVSDLTTKQLADKLGAELGLDWEGQSVVLANEHGLHARPATALSEIAKTAIGEIKVAVDNGAYVSAKSLTRLLSLGAVRGQTLHFIAEPHTDAVAVLPKIIEAVSLGLGESVSPVASASEPVAKQMPNFDVRQPIVRGEKSFATPASVGLAVAPAYILKPVRFEYAMTASDSKQEFDRLQNAIDDVKNDLKDTITTAKSASIAQIFTAHLALLEDEEVTHGAKDGIDDGLSAEASWHAHVESLAKTQSALANRLLAERASDLRDVGQKVLAKLTGQALESQPATPYVLIKEDLLPSDVAELNPSIVQAIITAVGGANSHSAIVARSLGIPAVVGAGLDVLDVAQGETVLVDGKEGSFIVAPSEALIDKCHADAQKLAQRRTLALSHAHESAVTTDGHGVEIAVNIGNVNDTKQAVDNGAEAVGLLRTELVFMTHQDIPNIDTQIEDYAKVFDALDGRPLVVRTLDIGGDKPLAYLPMPSEDNPFLGLRGIRLTLRQPELLKDQLIALIRASGGRDLRIMFPMVGQMEEWQKAKAILDEVRAEYPHDKLQVGMMIEVPSAAIMAQQFAKEVDFFSIGTNDLTQYVLAIDRGHALLSKDADGLHPSVLRLIHQTVTAAHAHGKWVGVCGELASDENAVPILVGLGVDELSMSASNIAMTKALVRELEYSACQVLAKRALDCATAKDVRALTQETV